MKLFTSLLIIGVTMFMTGCSTLDSNQIVATQLRCEYRENPIGIDDTAPRLSWIPYSRRPDQKQTAYQIIVARTKQNLENNIGDLWDTGKVPSDKSNHIIYNGSKLASRSQCFWKVRLWDADDLSSNWSKPARWSIGLINPSDWKAQWIGLDQPEFEYRTLLEKAKWIWYPHDDPAKTAPIENRLFIKKIEISNAAKIKNAYLALAVDDYTRVYLNGKWIGDRGKNQKAVKIDLSRKLKTGENTFTFLVSNRGKTENPAALIAALYIQCNQGPPTLITTDNSWQVSKNQIDMRNIPDIKAIEWIESKELGPYGIEPWGKIESEEYILPPPYYLRKTFLIYKPIIHATIHASALGLYELSVNGRQLTTDRFTPGWTDYNKRIYYNTYDVTEMLKRGKNAIGSIIADGWYAGYIGWNGDRDHYGKNTRLLAQLCIEYADGTTETIVTDPSWKAQYGPFIESDFLMGETYDARREIPNWNRSDLDDSDWKTVDLGTDITPLLQAYPGVTVKETFRIKPEKITRPAEGIYIFDMGQNFAGYAELAVKGKPGDTVTLRFAEMLKPDGTIYTHNLRKARVTDTYILKGQGRETWKPRFTYHGFRYVEITGYPGKPSLDSVTGIVLHSDTPVAGYFECSNEMVNKLYSNITWSQLSNFLEVPTDCPQRDERLGWTGDAQIFIRTATYNMDVAAFFTKWLIDLEDAQSTEGAFPDVAPRLVTDGDGTAAWGDAGVICPWTMYLVYGDTRVIEQRYESMKKWIDYLRTNSKDLLRPARGYGDWVSINANTPKDVIATAYFAYSSQLLSKMAAAIGKTQDAEKYQNLFNEIKTAFNNAYVSEDGRVKGDTQTCYTLALYFDLLPKDKRPLAAEHLVRKIEEKNYHLSTGFLGLSYLLPTLTETGRLDLAYRLLNNDTFPSWGYSIKNGATTIWERWNGWTEEDGFGDPGMNSFNHYSFGAVGQWLFATVAGIDTQDPAYKNIIIRPQPGGGLTYAKAVYNSIKGLIASHWQITDQAFQLDVTIPANTTATVHVPAEDPKNVKCDRKSAKFVRAENNSAVFEVNSGKYKFISTLSTLNH